MQSRNVIISLLLVLALLIFTFIKFRFLEPKKKLTFNRNPSRIEYSQFALCQMECYRFTANDITELLKKGEVNISESDVNEWPCPIFAVRGMTKSGKKLGIIVAQCGKVAKIRSCDKTDLTNNCDCPDEQVKNISLFKKNN